MKENKKIISTGIIYILFFLTVISFFNINVISNLINYYYIYLYGFFSIILIFLAIREKKFKINKKDLYIFFIYVSLLIFCYIVNKIPLGNVLIMICMPLYLFAFENIKIVIKPIKVMIPTLLTLFCYLLYTLIKYNGTYIYNPNTIAQLILYIMILSNYYFKYSQKSAIIILIFNILSFYAIYKTNCRNLLVVSSVYLFILYIVTQNILKNVKIQKILFISIIIVSIIIPVLFSYFYVHKSVLNINIPFSSKSIFSGREKIWTVCINSIKKANNIWIGSNPNDYLDDIYKLGYLNYNPHNISIGILVNYGIFVFILFYIILYNFYNIKLEKINEKTVYLKYGICMVLLAGCFENIIFLETFNFMFCLLFLDLNMERSELNREKDYKKNYK